MGDFPDYINGYWPLGVILILLGCISTLRKKKRRFEEGTVIMTNTDRIYFLIRDIAIGSILIFKMKLYIMAGTFLLAFYCIYKLLCSGEIKLIYERDISLDEKRQAVFNNYLGLMIIGGFLAIILLIVVVTAFPS